MFNYCPSCASKKITFEENKVFRCPDCSFTYYHNVCAANGCLIIVPDASGNAANDRFVFLVRGKEPGLGKLDLPGGFVDAGEGVIEGLYRELQEEIGWAPVIPEGANLCDVFTMYASFSNVYEYKNIKYNTCDMFFSVRALGLKLEDLLLEKNENTEILFLKRDEIDFNEIAFPSIRNAVKTYLKIPLT